MPNREFTFKIGGEAGYGIGAAGEMFAKSCLKSGFYVSGYTSYPSLIRGGHNTYTLSVCEEKIFSIKKPIDFLIALNNNTALFHVKELSKTAEIIINSDQVKESSVEKLKKFRTHLIPLNSLIKEAGGAEIMKNTVALGAAFFVLNGNFEILEKIIKDSFKGKDEEKVALNIKAALAGFNFSQKNFPKSKNYSISPKKTKENSLLLSGNDAICLGAVRAGCKVFVSYQMTPMNSLIAFFAQKGPELGIAYKQPEDEIAGINMAIGASFAGARAMTATSGGGFSLMAEGYGLAGMTETPLVIVEGQRPGPSTGLPTWGSQADLRFVLHASQDDFPRIVLAPGDPAECFWLTVEAFNLAEIYQTPVIILTDKHLAESQYTVDYINDSKVKIDRGFLLSPEEQKEEYKRYQITASGISPRAIPGRKGFTFLANSDEHSEFGFSEENAQNRIEQMEKRMRKLKTLSKKIPNPKVYGEKKANISIIGWGSSKGAVLEAQKILKKEGIKTSFLHLNYLNPFPSNFVSKSLSSSKNIIMLEQNSTAQCSGLIREKTGIRIEKNFLKYDGRPFFPEEIVQYVKKNIK